MNLRITSMANSTNIKLTVIDNDNNRELGCEIVSRGEDMTKALDRIFKQATLNKTDITEIELAAESGASETSQRITRAFQMAFDFVQAQRDQFNTTNY